MSDIDWTAEMDRFRPMMADSVVLRRTRQLSAAAVRATRYHGTRRGLRYTAGIGRRFAELVSVTAVRFDLVADLDAVHALLSNVAFGERPVYVKPRQNDLPNRPRLD